MNETIVLVIVCLVCLWILARLFYIVDSERKADKRRMERRNARSRIIWSSNEAGAINGDGERVFKKSPWKHRKE